MSFTLLLLSAPKSSFAQIEAPNREFLFLEDEDKEELRLQRKREIQNKKQAIQASASGQLPFDFTATSIDFDSSGQTVYAKDGLILSYLSAIAEASQGEFHVQTSEAKLVDAVQISDLFGNVLADEAYLNLETGAIELQNSKITLDEGGYILSSSRALRYPEDSYLFQDISLSTCNCPKEGGAAPWSITGSKAKVERNGYGQIWDATLRVKDFPILYVPYFIFPSKTERQSGFLPMTIGTGRRSGLELDIPFFWAIDNSTDATITGIFESNIRAGLDIEFRKIFSRNHKLELGILALDESAREGKLLGTNVSGLNDTTIDENRFAGYLRDVYQQEIGGHPFQLIADGRFVSDDVLLREYEKDEIGRFNTRFVTSRAVLRTGLFETFSVDVSTEFNQAMVDDDDFILQQYPSIAISGLNTFRPFAPNLIGSKMTLSSAVNVTNYQRSTSFDGIRAEIHERLKYPFHFKNYFDASLTGEVRATAYELDETRRISKDTVEEIDPVTGETTFREEEVVDSVFKKSTNRVVPGLTAAISTRLEKVFTLEEDSIWKTIGELGSRGRGSTLSRIKHTIEPNLKYRFVPSVSQVDNPQFNSEDRLERRNLISYGLNTRIYGRFEPRNTFLYGIEETAPEVSDFEALKSPGIIDETETFGVSSSGTTGYQNYYSGSKAELFRLTLNQTLDLDEERNGQTKNAFSDLDAGILFLPNNHFELKALTDFDIGDTNFRAYRIEGQFTDKRGDELRLAFRSNENTIRQLESSIEVPITEFLKAGYYARYDDLESEFIENRIGLRISSSCNCWIFDVEFSDQVNPDQTRVGFTVTLVGIGELGNTLFSEFTQQDS